MDFIVPSLPKKKIMNNNKLIMMWTQKRPICGVSFYFCKQQVYFDYNIHAEIDSDDRETIWFELLRFVKIGIRFVN